LEGYTIIRSGETLDTSTWQLSDLHGVLVRRVSRRQMHQLIDAGFVYSVRGALQETWTITKLGRSAL
jgi:hypothetical protein